MRKLGCVRGADVELSFDFMCSDVRKAPSLLLYNNNTASTLAYQYMYPSCILDFIIMLMDNVVLTTFSLFISLFRRLRSLLFMLPGCL